jgi:hypothetical protein
MTRPSPSLLPDRSRKLQPDPTPSLSGRILRARSEPKPWVQVADDQLRRPEDPLRRPRVSVEDAHPVVHRAGGGPYDHLAGEVANEPHVVVAQHDLDRQSVGEEGSEELEDHRSQRRRSPHDRVLHVPGDDDASRPLRVRYRPKRRSEESAGRFGGPPGPIAARPQPQVYIRHDEGSNAARPRFDQQGWGVEHRAQRDSHIPASRKLPMNLPLRSSAGGPTFDSPNLALLYTSGNSILGG